MNKIKQVLFTLLTLLILPTSNVSASFFDVAPTDPLYPIIDNLEKRNVITSAPEERFYPDNIITKEEFTEMVMRNIGIYPGSNESIIDEIKINDVDKYKSKARYIYKSIELGVTDTNPETNYFNPKKNISVLEGLQMLINAEGIHTPKFVNPDTWEVKNIDYKSWMAPLIQKSLEINLIELDENGFFFPYRSLSRGDAINLIYGINKDRIASMEEIMKTNPINNTNISVDGMSVPKLDVYLHVYQNVLDSYLKADELNPNEMMYSSIQGLLKEVDDPYTTFTAPSDDELTTTTILSSNFEGIGAEIAYKNDYILIVSPLKNGPAEKAGLKTDDLIIEINGVSTKNMASSKAAKLIRGEAGTQVELKIRREGKEDRIYNITREKIELTSLDIQFEENIAIIEISLFKMNTAQEFAYAVEEIDEKKPDGIIIDLRNNTGGILDIATAIASYFVPIGETITIMENNSGETSIFFSQGPGHLSSYPVVVLVNKGSASASEILAGALQDHNLATIMGEQTYGKGTVQKLFVYQDNSEFKLTIAKWLTPNENEIDQIGITPDIIVTRTDKDIENNFDPQMIKAKAEIKKMR